MKVLVVQKVVVQKRKIIGGTILRLFFSVGYNQERKINKIRKKGKRKRS